MLKPVIFALIAVFCLNSGLVLAADEAPKGKILSFSQWKDSQVNEAQNRVVRLNNKLTLAKADPKQSVRPLEVEIKGAIQSLEIAREFTMEHYIASYVAQLTSSKEDLKGLAQVLTPSEMAELIYVLANPKTQATNRKLTPFVSSVSKSSPAAL